jgi:hypothetical protein
VSIAEGLGARVVHEPLRGYGNAYLKGFAEARGKYLIMADADDTYDLNMAPQFLETLVDGGYDFVTGSRYLSSSGSRHITLSHRVIGNPMLTAILNYLFGVKYTDVYCGYRGFTREAYERIRPVSPGMEFNLELAINAYKAGLKIKEIPIELGSREGESKLHTVRDGWRSLRMMLSYCPNKVFDPAGYVSFVLGILIHAAMFLGLFGYKGGRFESLAAVLAPVLTVAGFGILTLGLTAGAHSWSSRFGSGEAGLRKLLSRIGLERSLILGALLVALGIVTFVLLIIGWTRTDSQVLTHPHYMSLGVTLIMLGLSIFFSSLFAYTMSMKRARSPEGKGTREDA